MKLTDKELQTYTGSSSPLVSELARKLLVARKALRELRHLAAAAGFPGVAEVARDALRQEEPKK